MTSRSNLNRLLKWSFIPLGTVVLCFATLQPASQAQPPSDAGTPANPDQQAGTQVLTRGPIHEAFGQPTIFNPKPGMTIPKKPPQPVEELPPDEKPEGDNVAWLGGYWSWDEDKNDFMWISGFWRILPPGRQWIPGYWNENAAVYQWVGGYWASMEQEQQEVIAQAPPDSLEQGAPPTAPSQEHIWVPGSWVYRDVRYMWRPGYWVVNQPGWAWTPSTYYWTPSGYIYVDGYWDWSIRRRGVLFAPCYFDPVVVYRPGYYYRPAVCLDIDIITPHFFCRPVYGHYYFGDYYATSYLNVGITPWFNVSIGRGVRYYSSDFAYYECHYRRTNPNWVIDCRLGYDRCRDNVALRPARTYVNQVTVINNITVNKTTNVNVNNMALAKPMKTYTANMAKSSDAPMKFERINEVKAREMGKTAVDVRKIAAERSNLDKANASGGAIGKTGNSSNTTSATRTMNLSKSPIAAKMASNGSVDNTPGSKSVNVGSIGGQPSKGPPPIPGSNVIKPSSRLPNNTGVVGSAGSGTGINPGNNKTGSTGAGSTGTKESTGAGTLGSSNDKTKSGTTGTVGGTGSGSRLPPVKMDPPKGSSSGNTKSGSSTGGSTGSKSGSSSSSGSKKDKDK